MRQEGAVGKKTPKPPVTLADLMFGRREPAPSMERRDFGTPLTSPAATTEEWHPAEVSDLPRLLGSAAHGIAAIPGNAYDWVAEGKGRDSGDAKPRKQKKVWTPWGALTGDSDPRDQVRAVARQGPQGPQGDLPYAMGTAPQRPEAPRPYGSGAYNAVNQMAFNEGVAAKEKSDAVEQHKIERGIRQDMLGIDRTPEPTYGNRNAKRPAAPGVGKIQEMGDDWYNALSDREKAAVDFNTLLVDAVKKDLANQKAYDPTSNQKDSYDAYVEEMFGKDRGSTLYAPETVGLLMKLGRNDKNGEWNGLRDSDADLDDFLGLNAAITADDLTNIDLNVPEATGVVAGLTRSQELENGTLPSGQYRVELSRMLADRTATMQESLAKGNAMLDTIYSTSLVSRNDILKEIGGLSNTPKTMLGYGETKRREDGGADNIDTYFRDAYDLIADKATKDERDAVLARISSPLKPDEWQQFWEYADQRSANALRFGTPLTDTKEVNPRSPQEFRAYLGLDEVKS